MSYIIIGSIGYILNSTSILIDKVLSQKSIPNPFIYTFYLGILGGVTFLLIPFGFFLPSVLVLIYSAFSGWMFLLGLFTFFTALRKEEPSKVTPIIGTLNIIFTIQLGLLFGQNLNKYELTGILVMLAGLVMLTSNNWRISYSEKKYLLVMVLSALFFALSSVLLREIFIRTAFINGLVWSRVFIFFSALTLLFFPSIRTMILNSKITKNHFVNKTSLLLIISQIMGAAGGLLVVYAIYLANPAVVNALAGIQYLFILVVILVLSKKYRHILNEEYSKKVLFLKIAGSILITLGLAVLVFGEK